MLSLPVSRWLSIKVQYDRGDLPSKDDEVHLSKSRSMVLEVGISVSTEDVLTSLPDVFFSSKKKKGLFFLRWSFLRVVPMLEHQTTPTTKRGRRLPHSSLPQVDSGYFPFSKRKDGPSGSSPSSRPLLTVQVPQELQVSLTLRDLLSPSFIVTDLS